MNYNMQGMVKTIPEVFSMLKSAEVEINKEHQVLMVNKTTKFKKGKGKKNFKKDGKDVAMPGKPVAGKKSKNGPKPETECFYCKGKGHWCIVLYCTSRTQFCCGRRACQLACHY